MPIVDPADNTTKRTTAGGLAAAVAASLPSSSVSLASINQSTYPANAADTEYAVPGLFFLGQQVYQKIVNFGALPNTTAKTVNHGISNLQYFTEISALAWTTGLTTLHLPFVNDANSTGGQVALLANGTQVVITSTSNRATFTTCYVTLRYTKSA